jgi:hypothetical protein
MKKFNNGLTHATLILCCLALAVTTAFADDTCVFMVTADNVEPNIVVLLDNGAEMQHAVWHTAYDDSADYTPNVSPKTDVVPNGASGNGFFNDAGYGIDSQGESWIIWKSEVTAMGSRQTAVMPVRAPARGPLTVKP